MRAVLPGTWWWPALSHRQRPKSALLLCGCQSAGQPALDGPLVALVVSDRLSAGVKVIFLGLHGRHDAREAEILFEARGAANKRPVK